MNAETEKVTYRFRKNVTYEIIQGIPHLQLSYPLKTICLHSAWNKVFQSLKTDEYVELGRVVSKHHHSFSDKIEFFFNDLVRKGFLKQKGTSSILNYPLVSIIIPVRNRPKDIKACLESLAQLRYPQERLEIIVVDDSSSDNTVEIIKEFPVQVIALKKHKQASYCRNLAASRAKGEILAFIDSDCLADPQWLLELIPSFKDQSIGAVGGFVDGYYDKSGLDCYEKVKSSLNMGLWPKKSKKINPFFYLPSCNLLVRREQFISIGGFKEKLVVGEDVDLCWRLRKKGLEIEYQPKGKIYHKHRNSIQAFCKRRFDYGTSEPMLHREHGEKIKRLYLPLLPVALWSCFSLSVLLTSFSFLFFCSAVALLDVQKKYLMVKKNTIRIKYIQVVVSTLRGYLAFFYHICSFVSRYYLLAFLFLFPIFLQISIVIIGMHLLAAMTEYFLKKKPGINIFIFIFYFSLEQISYQAGVWWGCLIYGCFKPINPDIISIKFSGDISEAR
jgi:mycofactocin system glycosyltransferase